MTLTFNPRQATAMPHTHYSASKDRSVQQIEWKQTYGQTRATDLFTFPTNASVISVLVIIGGNVRCCPLVSHVEYAPRALLWLEKMRRALY